MSCSRSVVSLATVIFFFQAEDGIRDVAVTGVQTCALPIYRGSDQHGSHRENGGVAGHAARGVADDDRELVAVVGSGGGGCGVGGGGGCADRRAGLLSLVAQGGRARGRWPWRGPPFWGRPIWRPLGVEM